MTAVSIKSQVKKMTSVAAIIGNILSHYNKHLYVFLIPFISPLFFPSDSKIVSLLMGYLTIPLGMLGRPFGGYFFGKIGDIKGRETALSIALFGISCCTILMIMLPTYARVGVIAPMALILLRMGYNFFSAGSTSGAFVTVLGKSSSQTRGLWSGIHTSSSVIGILVASFSVTVLALFDSVESSWRVLYVIGLASALFGYYFKKAHKKTGNSSSTSPRISFVQLINSHKKPLIIAVCLYAYSRVMYEFSIGFLNGYIPIISSVPQKMATSFDTGILLLDVCLLPIFGLLSDRVGAKKAMSFAAIAILLFVPLSLGMIPYAPFVAVLGIKTTIAMLAMLFTVPAYVWAFECAPEESRFSVIALGNALGTQAAGISGSLCLYLYKVTLQPSAPSIFIVATSLLMLWVIFFYSKERTSAKAS
jgi:MFS family permease